MYKYSSQQISLSDFKQPVGMHLKESNRWVQKAQSIPWTEIEERYAKLFTNRKGNVAKPLRLALGACIIQAEYGYSDAETALQIQENPYLQYFCGYPGYDDERLPFDSSTMVYFRKRLTPEVLGEINELILKAEQDKGKTSSKPTGTDKDDDDHHDTGSATGDENVNEGTLIVDATCAPSNIRYPQDVSVLNETRENAELMIDELSNQSSDPKPRTYRKKAHKDFLSYVRNRRHTTKKTREAIRKQLQYLKRDLSYIDSMLSKGLTLSKRLSCRLETIRKVYEQQKEMYDKHSHSVDDRIVSVSQPFLRPIVRGKAGKPVEFGAKLDISISNGYTRLEYWSFDAYNEATRLIETIERYKAREGHYPERVLADKIYRNRENLNYCSKKGIRLSGPALGRPKKNAIRNKVQDYLDQNERIEVERRFSLAKRKCNLGKVKTKLKETVGYTIAMSIVVLNLRKIQFAIFSYFERMSQVLGIGFKTRFVQ